MSNFIFDTEGYSVMPRLKKMARGCVADARDGDILDLYYGDEKRVNMIIRNVARSLLEAEKDKVMLTGSEFYLVLVFHKDRNILSKKLLDEFYRQAQEGGLENIKEFRYLIPEFEKFLNTVFFGFSKFPIAQVRELISKVISNIKDFPPRCLPLLEDFLFKNQAELVNIFFIEDNLRFGSREVICSLIENSVLGKFYKDRILERLNREADALKL